MAYNGNTVELASQEDLALLALESREHAAALDEILAYGLQVELLFDAGCSTDEARAAVN